MLRQVVRSGSKVAVATAGAVVASQQDGPECQADPSWVILPQEVTDTARQIFTATQQPPTPSQPPPTDAIELSAAKRVIDGALVSSGCSSSGGDSFVELSPEMQLDAQRFFDFARELAADPRVQSAVNEKLGFPQQPPLAWEDSSLLAQSAVSVGTQASMATQTEQDEDEGTSELGASESELISESDLEQLEQEDTKQQTQEPAANPQPKPAAVAGTVVEAAVAVAAIIVVAVLFKKLAPAPQVKCVMAWCAAATSSILSTFARAKAQ